MKITLRNLKAKGACEEQVALFKETFGQSVEVTEETCDKAVKAGLDFNWASANLLSRTQLAEYDRVQGLARAEYERVQGPALAEYQRIRGPAWAEYKRIEGLARAEYMRIEGPAFYQASLIK